MSPTTYKFLTDALVVFHFTFVGFVIAGGLLALRWRVIAWLHVPAVLWVIYAESTDTICPLTPLENRWRQQGSLTTYEGSFVDHYIMPVLYPDSLDRQMQIGIAVGLIVLNGACYGWLLWKSYRRRQGASSDKPTTPPTIHASGI